MKNKPTNTKNILKPKQKQMIDLLVDYTDTSTITAKCAKVGITKATFYAWIKKPEFFNFYIDQRERVLKSHAGHIDRALTNGAIDGKAELIKLYYQRIGELTDKEDKEINITLNIPRPDLKIENEKP